MIKGKLTLQVFNFLHENRIWMLPLRSGWMLWAAASVLYSYSLTVRPAPTWVSGKHQTGNCFLWPWQEWCPPWPTSRAQEVRIRLKFTVSNHTSSFHHKRISVPSICPEWCGKHSVHLLQIPISSPCLISVTPTWRAEYYLLLKWISHCHMDTP